MLGDNKTIKSPKNAGERRINGGYVVGALGYLKIWLGNIERESKACSKNIGGRLDNLLKFLLIIKNNFINPKLNEMYFKSKSVENTTISIRGL